MHFCPFTLFLCKILIHFFSLPWAIENTLGSGGLFKPSNISLMEYTVKLCYWFGNKCEVILKPCGIKWKPTNKIQQDEGKLYSPKAQFCIPLLGADNIILGCWASTESLNLNDSTDRGVIHHHTHFPGFRGGSALEWSMGHKHSAGILPWKQHNLASMSSLSMRENPSLSMSAIETKEPGLFLQDVSWSLWSSSHPWSK